MKMRNEYTCPLELIHDIIKGKWKPVILWKLSKGGSSLSVLIKSIMGISQKIWHEGVTDPDYCVLRFTAEQGRFYSNFNSENFEIE
mgnify:FL=1